MVLQQPNAYHAEEFVAVEYGLLHGHFHAPMARGGVGRKLGIMQIAPDRRMSIDA